MDVCAGKNYLSCGYTNGYKYKIDGGWIYRKDWDTDEIVKLPLQDEELVARFDEHEVIDPYNNSREWCFLRDLWKDARKIAESYDEKPIKCTEEDDF